VAIEIEDVWFERMLAAELASGESAVAEQGPNELLFIRLGFAKFTGEFQEVDG
jgi:hypothetical protein